MNYRLTDNKKVFNGETLYQIECVEDCKWAKKGDLGGYIAGYSNLEDGGWVGKIGCVCDSSVVCGCLVEGLVAGGSVVEGKVKGVVIRNSFVDKDCDLDCAWVINSSVYNSNSKALYYKENNLSLVMLLNSCVNDTEMYGFVNVVRSSIEKSYLEWQYLIFMNIEDGYLMENYVDDDFEKTGEVKTRKVGTERIAKADEEVKSEFIEIAEKCERGEYEEYFKELKSKQRGLEEFESFNEFYEYNNDMEFIDIIYKNLEEYKTDETEMTGWRKRELNKLGYQLSGRG